MASAKEERSPVRDAVAHYESLLNQHGAVSSGVGWNSEFAQNERFAQLCEILPREDEHLSILDFGCGFGSLFDFLAPRRKHFTYVGYDASRHMIECARHHHGEAQLAFENNWDHVPACDYAVASGVFNVRGDWSDGHWQRYVQDTLQSIHDRASRGWSANFLSTYSDHELMKPELYYADPLALFDWCKRNLSRFVALHHDYPLYDFTILVRKENR